jgi:hypothetical protein
MNVGLADDLRIRSQIPLVPGPVAHTLDRVHQRRLLGQEGVAQFAGPGHIGCHHLKYGRKRSKACTVGSHGKWSSEMARARASPVK